jgi:hypothetical protein
MAFIALASEHFINVKYLLQAYNATLHARFLMKSLNTVYQFRLIIDYPSYIYQEILGLL